MGIILTTRKRISDLEYAIMRLKLSLNEEQQLCKKKIQEKEDECTRRIRSIQEESALEIESVKNDANQKVNEIIMRSKEAIDRINNDVKVQLEAERKKSLYELTELKEHIESRKEILETASEKSLLVDVMMALEGYASRLNRLEERLNVQSIEDASKKINNSIYQLTEGMKNQMNRMLVSFTTEIEKLDSDMEEKINSFDIAGSIYELVEKLRNVEEKVESISDRIGDYDTDYGSVWGSISEVKSAAEDAKSAAEDAKSAAEDAKYACESNGY